MNAFGWMYSMTTRGWIRAFTRTRLSTNSAQLNLITILSAAVSRCAAADDQVARASTRTAVVCAFRLTLTIRLVAGVREPICEPEVDHGPGNRFAAEKLAEGGETRTGTGSGRVDL